MPSQQPMQELHQPDPRGPLEVGGSRLPRSVWRWLFIAPILVAACVYGSAWLTGLPLADEKIVVGLLALFGVLSTSILSSILAIFTLLEARQKGEKDRQIAIELAAHKEVHDRDLAVARAQHERELAEALSTYERQIAATRQEHEHAIAQARAVHEKELAARAQSHSDSLQQQKSVHERALQEQDKLNKAELQGELERVRYLYSLRKDVDQREYNDLIERINQISRAAVNAKDAVQKLSRRASEMLPDDVVDSTGLIFVTVAPLFASPAAGSPVLPRTLVKLLVLLRGRFTTVFLALSEKQSERKTPEYLADLRFKLAELGEGVKRFVDEVEPAKARLRDEMTSEGKHPTAADGVSVDASMT